MQMICETYDMMKNGLGMSNQEMHEVFAKWNTGVLDSYLVEITRDILGYKDEDGVETVDVILDKAGQKGTGKWTAISALDVGQPLTLIGEAVFARCLSALKDERVEAAKVLDGPGTKFEGDKSAMVADLEQALYASKIVSYAQGYQLMRAISDEKDWGLNYGAIALMWRGGCIIRSAFLNNIRDAFEKDAELTNLLLDDFFQHAVENAQAAWRRVVSTSVTLGIPMPAIGAALAYLMVIEQRGCQRTYYRLNVITSVLILTSELIKNAVSFSTPTGLVVVARRRQRPTTRKRLLDCRLSR